MTDQTVPVSVDLLKKLREAYPANAARTDGSPIATLAALIPDPPKVGDVLTAVQVYDLPPRSTFVDEDDDVYIVYEPRKIKRLTNAFAPNVLDIDEVFESDAADSDYNQLRVTFIPKGSASE